MKRMLYTIPALLILSAPLSAQTAEDSVVAVIVRFFDAMRSGDSALARTSFTSDAMLYRALPTGLSGNSIDGIIRSIGTPRDSVLDEQIWNTVVHLDGHLASVWTDYAFYIGSRLNHCGVDSFQMYRQPDGWKIYLVTDTQRQEGCHGPPNR